MYTKLSNLIIYRIKKSIPLVLFLVVMMAIVFILPKKVTYKYKYTKGQPWAYEDLISSFDFPVSKSKLSLEKEKDSIKKNFVNYFQFSDNFSEGMIKKFQEDMKQFINLKKFTKNDSTKVEKFTKKFSNDLKNIYQKGIISAGATYKSETLINVIHKGIATKAFVGDFYTEKQAFLKLHTKLDSFKNQYKIQLPKLPAERYIAPNIEYDKAHTERMLKRKLENVSPVTGMIKKGERIISRGEPINNKTYAILESLKAEYEQSKGTERSNYLTTTGKLLLLTIIFSVFFIYLRVSEPKILKNNKHLLFLLITILLFSGITSLFIKYPTFDIYLIPYAILPILTVNFHNVKLSVFHYTIMIIVISFFVTDSIEFIFTQLMTGYVAAIGVSKLQNRRQILVTVGLILVAFTLSYLGFTLLKNGDFSEFQGVHILTTGISSIFVLISYPLIYLFERIFGYLSNISLLEMSDLNHPLLKKLSQETPGTFQHSLQVANIAESVAYEIGANPLLVRTGALFHDIGKMENPQYFIENQSQGYNPHDKLKPEESAEIIRNHVTDGIKMARKKKLPETIINFIRTHHGTSVIYYFYHMAKTTNPNKEIDEALFSYPGPRPRTKEEAILMFTDSVEAASRSLKKINEETINNLIEGIIDKQIKAGQIQEANITFAEIARVKQILKDKIKNIYHTRIEYPEDDKTK